MNLLVPQQALIHSPPWVPWEKEGNWKHWAGRHLHSKRTELQPPVCGRGSKT